MGVLAGDSQSKPPTHPSYPPPSCSALLVSWPLVLFSAQPYLPPDALPMLSLLWGQVSRQDTQLQSFSGGKKRAGEADISSILPFFSLSCQGTAREYSVVHVHRAGLSSWVTMFSEAQG